jgi:RNA 3'-terminal phosphate cyclase
MSLGRPEANKARLCANTRKVINIDGSLLEGGGQSNIPMYNSLISVLRNTAAYACITGTSVHIQNIRSKRTIPGIKAQQIDGLEFIAEISNGILQNGQVGSREILFHPGIGNEELPTEFIVDQKLGFEN